MTEPTQSTTPDASTTRRYLLGRLAEAERQRLEERLLSDGAAYAQVLAAEDELIDEYVAGELSAADRRAFEERLLGVGRIRERVGFARSLRALAAEEAVPPAAAPRDEGAGWADRLAALLGFGRLAPSPAFAAVTAAAFVLLVGICGWLGWRAAELAGRVESLQARAAAGEAALTEARAAGAAERGAPPASGLESEPTDAGPAQASPTEDDRAAAAAALERERERAERLAERVAELESRPAPKPKVTAAFILSLATRASAGLRQIAVPDDADTVRLQLEAGGGPAGSLRARLLTAGGRVAWTGPATVESDGSLVVAELPAELLTSGRYELLLEATLSEGDEPELVGAYEFKVR